MRTYHVVILFSLLFLLDSRKKEEGFSLVSIIIRCSVNEYSNPATFLGGMIFIYYIYYFYITIFTILHFYIVFYYFYIDGFQWTIASFNCTFEDSSWSWVSSDRLNLSSVFLNTLICEIQDDKKKVLAGRFQNGTNLMKLPSRFSVFNWLNTCSCLWLNS